jgi:hypothetical protein
MTTNLWYSIARSIKGLSSHSRAGCSRRGKSRCWSLEQLERRYCLATAVFELGSSLIIAGDAGDDLIEIVDNGGGTLDVNGVAYSDIDRVVINTQGGADRVSYETEGEVSISSLLLNLGWGDDVADLDYGTVGGKLRSEIFGDLGNDEISTSFAAVLSEGEALSFMDGGWDDDIIRCAANNVAGLAACVSRGGVGADQIFCSKLNVFAGGEAVCESIGGIGDDMIMCTEMDVAGHTECIGDGGLGNDVVSCTLTNLAETGSALCQQSGGAGDDVLTCSKGTILGQHVCFINGGAGNDIMNWVVTGIENSGDFQCNADAGAGNDQINLVLGTETAPVDFKGVVDYFADTGSGDDEWNAIVNFTGDSDGVVSTFTVLLGDGSDTALLGFIGLGNTQILAGLVDGEAGDDTYLGPPPMFLTFDVSNFEIGV